MTNNTSERISLRSFVRGDRNNVLYLRFAIGISIVGFILFKLMYPYPDFYIDSYSYLHAAATNASVNIWPIGYSKFLWAIHQFSHSDTLVVAIQYFLVLASQIYFFFSVLYFYRLKKDSRNLLFLFLFLDPLFWFLCNYIGRDGLFLACSLAWFSQLLWLIHRPNVWGNVFLALFVFLAFTLRYEAIVYPIVSVIVIAWLRGKFWEKVPGALAGLVLIGLFAVFTRAQNYKETGNRVLSVASGWKMANNVLFMYPHISVDSANVPSGCKKLDDSVRYYFRHCKPRLLTVSPVDGWFYIRELKTPLNDYLARDLNITKERRPDDTTSALWLFGAVSPVYAEYARFLMRHYPAEFSKHYLLPNTWTYLWAPFEKLDVYNMQIDTVQSAAQQWFDFKTRKIDHYSKYFQYVLVSPLPIFFLLINLGFALGIGWFIYARRKKQVVADIRLKQGLLLASVFLLLNALCCIYSGPLVYEDEVFPTVICFAYVLVLYDLVERKFKTQ